MTIRAESMAAARRSGFAIAATAGLLLAAVLIAWFARWGPDWPAQEFRAWSAAHDGLTAWTNRWYSGLALPGYSVLYPVLGGALGASLTGILAVAAAYLGAAAFAPSHSDRVKRLGYQFTVAFLLCASLLIGQIPYLVGIAIAAWALRAARGGRPVLAATAAAACSLASPLAGAFLLISTPAVIRAIGVRRGYPLLAAAAGAAVAAVFGGGSGPFPFRFRSVVWIAVFVALVFVCTRRRDKPVRYFAACYALATVAALAVANPIGGNLTRLGQLAALPLVWIVSARLSWRMTRTVALALAAAMWTAWPAVSSITHGATDPSQHRAYYAGLLAYLHSRAPRDERIEVVFTREHWEALYVARAYPIARGWERQTDLAQNPVLYDPLTAAIYRNWLDANGVGLIALPTAPIDYGGQAEAVLLRHPPPYLTQVWHDHNWRVWRVHDARPLVTGAAALRAMGSASLVLAFRHAGTAKVRIRASTLWAVSAGAACLRDNHGWLDVTASRAGLVTLRSRISTLTSGRETGCG